MFSLHSFKSYKNLVQATFHLSPFIIVPGRIIFKVSRLFIFNIINNEDLRGLISEFHASRTLLVYREKRSQRNNREDRVARERVENDVVY